MSDGKLTPEEAEKFYLEHGYDFLAITDHRCFSQPTHISGNMLVLIGTEADYFLPAEAVHIELNRMANEMKCEV